MSLALVCWSLFLATSTPVTFTATDAAPGPGARGVAYFEPPRSVGTPVAELARVYEGVGLADRIAGRLRLDTDASLDSAAREQIRRHLAHRN